MPGLGAQPGKNSSQRIATLDLDGRRGLARRVVLVFLFEDGLCQRSGLRSRRIGCAQGPFCEDFAAGRVYGLLGRLSDKGGHLLCIQFLAVFVGKDAVQLDQGNVGFKLAVGASVCLERRRVGVEQRWIERRDALCLAFGTGARRATRRT
ncbi:MAG: hypothetical protein HC869_25320 [Rhodospirillales bacterium]|nr:hypothetical protein [Rhodospirillales bacterium]